MANLDINDRMRRQYEHATRHRLPRRTYTIVRVDGRAFHTYTAGMVKPFDLKLMADLQETARALMMELDGARLGFSQSDEISILMVDFEWVGQQAWFDGVLQKICSVSASIATAAFARARAARGDTRTAHFDSRVFTIPDLTEVENYFIGRQLDASTNSVSQAASAYFSHEELEHKSGPQKQEMLFQRHGINWSQYQSHCKNGAAHVRSPGSVVVFTPEVTPIFTSDRGFLQAAIPSHPMSVQRAEAALHIAQLAPGAV